MTDKAYIVANEQQEREVLEKLEREGLVWFSGREVTEWIPSQSSLGLLHFPYSLVDVGYVAWRSIEQLENYEIVYDGRREDKMKISKEVYDALVEWKNHLVPSARIYVDDVAGLYSENVIRHWWQGDGGGTDANNRLIATLRWVNGEDVFEVEKPKKWIVRSKETDNTGDYGYVAVSSYNITYNSYIINDATKFDTKEEAQSWASSHQEVVEIEV